MTYIFPLASVLLGAFIGLVFQPKNKKNLKLLLAFSGAFLLSITVMHLLPEVYHTVLHEHNHEGSNHNHTEGYRIGLFIMVGILFQIVLEFFSKGAEHGHVHTHEKMNTLPWALFISLCLHALLEGIPVSHHHNLAIGIAIHHLPIAVILTTFFNNAGLAKKWIILFMVAFAMMTPFGTLISEELDFLTQYYTEISAIVIGILFHISSTIIFESSENHKFNLAKISAIVLGILLGYLI